MQLYINIDVYDLEAAIVFYTAAVGLTLARRLFDGSVAEMAGAAVPIHLVAKPAASAPVAEANAISAKEFEPLCCLWMGPGSFLSLPRVPCRFFLQ